MSGLHFHGLRVASVQAEADDAQIIGFEVPAALREPFAFQPGQYLTLRATVAGEDLRRSYSICAGPGEALRIGVRRVPGGAFSGWLHTALQPGDRIDVMPPQGRFGAALVAPASPAAPPRHLLAVAGGSGITPVLAILKAALAADASTRITLVYANRTLASTMFKEELEDLKNRHLARLSLFTLFSREAAEQPLQSGRLDADRLATLLRLAGPVHQAFVCGPYAMNDAVEAALRTAGIAPESIHVERFGIPPAADAAALHAPRPGDAPLARVRVQRDGLAREVEFRPGDASLLEAATRSGLDLPFSCRSGVCATCRAKVLQGQVRMDRNFALEADEVQAGFVLTCQAHPLSERVVLSFDER